MLRFLDHTKLHTHNMQ